MTAKAAVTPFICISASLLLAACGRYAEFTLPPLAGAVQPVTVSLQPEPVLSPGASGWDSSDVLNPSVIFHAGRYLNFYSGFDGQSWRTGLAESPDGLHWKKMGRVLSPDRATWESGYIAANGSALFHAGQFWYWYQTGPRDRPQIALARSADGRNWHKVGRPVLPLGPRGSWDERAVADPYVLRAGSHLYLYYLGQDRARRQQIGLARSEDGVVWTKLRSNPIIPISPPGSGAMDENGVGEPAVWASKTSYWMLFTGRDSHESRALGSAWSHDGVHWTRMAQVIHGSQTWNAQVVCDPSVLVEGSRVRLWFGGGDAARPDEHVHGQIGTGEIAIP